MKKLNERLTATLSESTSDLEYTEIIRGRGRVESPHAGGPLSMPLHIDARL